MIDRQRMIKVDNPCPMTLGRIKNDTNFYCKSCDKIIIDFRDKSVDEIVNYISKQPTCGIFNNDQVVKPNFTFKKNFLFKVLTILAVLGFNVKPLGAQTKQEILNDTSNIQRHSVHLKDNTGRQINSGDTTRVKVKTEKKKWWRKKKKPNYRTIGCPAF